MEQPAQQCIQDQIIDKLTDVKKLMNRLGQSGPKSEPGQFNINDSLDMAFMNVRHIETIIKQTKITRI